MELTVLSIGADTYPDPSRTEKIQITPGYFTAHAYEEELLCEGSLCNSAAFYQVHPQNIQDVRQYPVSMKVFPDPKDPAFFEIRHINYVVIAPRKFKIKQYLSERRTAGHVFKEAEQVTI